MKKFYVQLELYRGLEYIWEDGNEDKNLEWTLSSLGIQEAFDGDHTVSQ